jgi:hypothetical protein
MHQTAIPQCVKKPPGQRVPRSTTDERFVDSVAIRFSYLALMPPFLGAPLL